MIPANSPVLKALAATRKAVEHEQHVLKTASRTRVDAAREAIERVGNLVNYNPTIEQCAAMVAALQEAVDGVRAQFRTVVPRQVTLDLEGGDNGSK